MAHLVSPIDVHPDHALPVSDVLKQLRTAHHYLARLGIEAQAIHMGDLIEPEMNWGTRQKRAKIIFPDGERPALIPVSLNEHALSEVINQCATIERLVSALAWASEALPDYRLIRCHPTTSSYKTPDHKDIPDNDIVLVNANGRLALFEVSDVIRRDRDGNQKEFKDLASLGVRLAGMDDYPENKNPFVNRLFMVVSEEFGVRWRNKRKGRRKKKQPYFRYYECQINDGATCIFEVLPPLTR